MNIYVMNQVAMKAYHGIRALKQCTNLWFPLKLNPAIGIENIVAQVRNEVLVVVLPAALEEYVDHFLSCVAALI